MNKKISVNLALAIAIIAMTVTFSVTMILSQNLFDKTVASVREKEIMYNKIAELDKTVRADYYGDINDETLYDMMGAGYMQGIADSNARYYTAKQYSELLDEQSGKTVGVGVDIIKEANGYARVIRVYNGSPATDAGITKNSYITKIGETDVKSLSLNQVNNMLRGEAGTTVSLTMINAAAEEMPALQLQRRQYDMPSVEYSMVPGKSIGYIRLLTFNVNTAKEVEDAIAQLKQTEGGLKALVFDVRNNNGGTLSYAIDVVDLLCPAGAVASTLNKDGTVTLMDTSDIKEVDLPMVALVNANTAAGAELFATSLRDFGKGRVVGVTTAGKGSLQCAPKRLSDGSAVSFTIGMLLTKNEASFDGAGVVPDVEVSLKAEEEKNFYDLTVETDPQIAKALETVASLLTKQNNQTASGEAQSTSESASAAPESTSASSEAAVAQ